VALGLDADTSFRAPMGIVVIGGLITSTILSLVVVPVVFTYVLRAERLLRRFTGGSGEPFAARKLGDAVPGSSH
jgi:hypothetical protein